MAWRYGVALFVCVCVACTSKAPPDTSLAVPGSPGVSWLEEVAAASGVTFRYRSGHTERYYLPEVIGGGVALLDYDGDGDLDLYFVQGGDWNKSAAEVGNVLYQNRGDGTFDDVTGSAAVGDVGYGMGCAVADYDGDGDLDLYVTNVGPNVLYRNEGNGSFSDVTAAAGVGDEGFGTSVTFLDYDSDGHLDLFVTNYLVWSKETERECYMFGQLDYCSPKTYKAPAPDTLYHNRGDGTFEDVSAASGIRAKPGTGLGVVAGDLNGDGNQDLYVANDAMANRLWLGDGSGHFVDDALLTGCALNGNGIAEAGMGVMAVDIENDGDLDIFVTHQRTETNTLYVNRKPWFEDVTAVKGLGAPSVPFTGFGLGFADFDQDGVLDLYVANGRVERAQPVRDPKAPYAEPNQLFRGSVGGRYVEIQPHGGTAQAMLATSRGAAFGDLDNDGDVDIVVSNRDGPAHVLHNRVDNQGHWLQFSVRRSNGRPSAGARVSVVAGGKTQWRLVQPGYSYLASNDPRVHFGLGVATRVDQATVHWPGGKSESFGPFEVDQHIELVEGSGRE